MEMTQQLWSSYVGWLLSMTGGSIPLAGPLGFLTVELAFFYIPCILLEILEHIEGHERFRIEAHKATRREVVYKAWRDVSVSVFIVHPLLGYFIFQSLEPRFIFDTTLPGWRDFLGIFILGNFMNDMGFYWSHRLFHTPWLYKLHKVHHEFNFTRGIAAQYCHPIEAVVCNTLPTFAALITWGFVRGELHVALAYFWPAMRLLETLDAHSGFAFTPSFYLFPSHWFDHGFGSHDTGHHYFHHSHNTGNFGSPIMDWIFGTDTAYRKFLSERKKKAA